MRVYIHTFVVRVVSGESDTEGFAQDLAFYATQGPIGQDAALSVSIETLPSGLATVPEMPDETDGTGDESVITEWEAWCRDYISPLIGHNQ